VSPQQDPVTPLAVAFGESVRAMLGGVPGGWWRAGEGAFAGVSGAPAASLNGVTQTALELAPEVLRELLAEVAATGLPHGVQLRPGARDDLVAVLEEAGLSFSHEVPLLALDARAGLAAEADATQPPARALEPAEAELHWRLGAAAFETPAELFATIAGPAVLAQPGVRAYVVEDGGEAVATALSVLTGRYAAIFNVATLAAHRRRGLGAAVTAFAVREAFAAGARTAWLQSSPMALGLYERMGFTVLECWSAWTSGEPET